MPLHTNDDQAALIRGFLEEKALKGRKIDRNVINRRAAVAAGRDLNFAEELDTSFKAVFKAGWYKGPTYKGKKKKFFERCTSIVLSDTHFQSLLDPEECPKKYGPHEEARRLGAVAAETADYKRQYRHESRCNVLILGDMIQGQLHDMREGAPLAVQMSACISYLIQFLMFMGTEYPEVDAYCMTGNHGRNKSRHHDRAVQQKFDSNEQVIYYAVQQAIIASGVKNIRVHLTKRPYWAIDVFGQKIFATHGDTVLKIGYPGNVIKINEVQKQILKWNAAKDVGGPFSAFIAGHVHIGSDTILPGRIHFMTNGCLVPPDAHSLSIGSAECTCGMQLFESVRGHAIGDRRFIYVDDADSVSAFEKIIKPFGTTW